MNVIISKDNPWSRELANLFLENSSQFVWITECNLQILDSLNPKWVFFFHWSEIVSEEIYTKYKCVVVHTGNLPEGRGGSPLQNQILEGVVSTKVNLIEMSSILDGGGIYTSSPITLQGNLNDIWFTIAKISKKLILECVNNSLSPIPQTGEPKVYKRKKDNKLILDSTKDISYVYDQIRMLDAENYPQTYLEIGEYILEFSRAKLENKTVIADVKITKK